MNKQISIIREKLKALNNAPTLWLLSDCINIIKETLFEKTGLKLKNDGKEIDNIEFLNQLTDLYNLQLKKMLEDEVEITSVRQITLEESIAEIKGEQNGQ